MSNICQVLCQQQDKEQGLGSNQNAIPFNNQDFEKLRQECLESGKLFCDPTFPAEISSLGYNTLGKKFFKDYVVPWKRPTELCPNPEFISGGATRTDICQGTLGNCWLLASFASLTMNTEILERVVPPNQSFTENYAGIFHFQIWYVGRWVDVVIDDRLPTFEGKLAFLHSAEGNEFWSALLEKAYAKLCSSYEALSEGSTAEGFEALTGGISEIYELRRAPATVFNIMKKALDRGSLLGCSIYTANTSESEMVTNQKLVKGHAYSITGAEVVHVNGKTVELVRLRNPWGHVEWNGAWSDNSSEWDQVSPEEKSKLNHSADDGEFWMAFPDFKKLYNRMEICNLTPDTLTSDEVTRWSYHLFEGSWKAGSTAGGCKNFPDTFCSNPQFMIKLEELDDDPHDGKPGCSFLVGLMQKGIRNELQFGQSCNVIGFIIYKVPDEFKGQTNLHLGPDVLLKQTPVAMSKSFIDLHEVCGRFKLLPGEYLIVPSTYEPHKRGDFILRFFAEKHATAGIMDNDIKANIKEVKVSTKNVDPEFQRIFKTFTENDPEISAATLQKILDQVVSQRTDLKTSGFTLETCRNVVSLLDKDGTGKLGLLEFQTFWVKLQKYMEIFKTHDKDNSGTMNSHEMREALSTAGFQLNTTVLEVIVLRYSDQQSTVDFDDFVACLIRLELLFQMFSKFDKNNTGKIELDILQWLCLALS